MAAYAIMAEQVLEKCRIDLLSKARDGEATAYLRVQANLWGDWLSGDTLVEHVIRVLTSRHARNSDLWFAAATSVSAVFPGATPIVPPDLPPPRVLICTIDL